MDNSTTARVDLQRLQILNDRLCQTLEALNQVRMSAHNIAIGNGMFGNNPYATASTWGSPTLNTGFNAWGTPHYGIPSYGFGGYGIPNTAWGVPSMGAPSFTPGMNPMHTATAFTGARPAHFAQPAMW